MQIYTSNGRIRMKDGKIGIGSDCCSLTCDSYGGGGGGGGCNDDIMGICCVPGTGGTCGEATQCGCNDAGGTWRFAEVDGREVSPGVIDKCSPGGVEGFLDENGNAYTVCACDPAENVTIVWRDLQPHPDFDRVSNPPLVACNRCRSFPDISEFEELVVTGGINLQPGTGNRGLILCGDQDCYDPNRDPIWIWGDPDGPDPSLLPGDSDVRSLDCNILPNSKVPPCRDLDGDEVDDYGTGDPNGMDNNPCFASGADCGCSNPYNVGYASGVWSNANSWISCDGYGYGGDCCGVPGCPDCP